MAELEDGETMICSRLEESLTKKLDELPVDFTYSQCCIYRVPNKIRRANEEAYTPRLVSIGPLHRGNKHLHAMERYKVRCLQSYLARCPEYGGNSFNLKSASEWAVKMESELQLYYEEINNELKSEELSEMILLDGVFIVELLLENFFSKQRRMTDEISLEFETRRMRDEIDKIFDTNWMINDLLHDMILLENQLPYRVPFELFEVIKTTLRYKLNFVDLIRKFFNCVGGNNEESLLLREPKHLLDYLLNVHLENIHQFLTPNRGKPEYPYTATVLQEAGVKFRTETNQSSRFLDVEFEGGVLTMPTITVNDWTEAFFRNLIAFEQCHHRPRYVTSYAIFMDGLINTSKDVDILVECGIIKNSFADNQQVADLFNNLYKEVTMEDSEFYYSRISELLNGYRRNKWHQWKAAWYNWKLLLMRNYFSNPWSIISLIGAIFLLALAIVQAVCSILQVKLAK